MRPLSGPSGHPGSIRVGKDQISHKEVDQIPIRPCGVLVVGLVENDRLFFPTPLRVRGEPTTDSIAPGERHDCGLKLSGRGLAGDHYSPATGSGRSLEDSCRGLAQRSKLLRRPFLARGVR